MPLLQRRLYCWCCCLCWDGPHRRWEGETVAIDLTVERLTARRQDRVILDGVSFRAPEGSTTVLMGASGCGKSTLLRILNRIDARDGEPQLEGSIRLGSQEILRPMDVWELVELRRQVGMVFQTPAPFPMSIRENVAYGIRLHERLPRAVLQERVEEALEQAALLEEVRDRLGSDARRLSGGQQQRLCIARALAVRPQVLLLDEPTSALDPLSTRRIEELLLSLRGKVTVLLVTHQPAQAHRLAQRLLVMENGKIAVKREDALACALPDGVKFNFGGAGIRG